MADSLIDLPVWKKAIKASPDPDRATSFLKQLPRKDDFLLRATPERARILAALLSGSIYISNGLIKHPERLRALDPELLRNPRREQGLRREVAAWLGPALQSRDHSVALAKLREFQQRELTRLAGRDLARLSNAADITLELSNLADVCLSAVLSICQIQLAERFGKPYHLTPDGAWLPTSFSVLGLGKLGGQELNYSSDVDLMFVYSEEGHALKEPPRKSSSTERALTNHQYFKRLAEAFVAEITRPASEGMLYRVDLRLRPEGDSGPWVRSLPSYEAFYSQWGQTWERMMLIKARGVAGDPVLANEFTEMVQPFRYPRSLPVDALGEVAAMKLRMEKEVVKAGEIDRNVKLGRGGIREIEFIVQSTQLLHGGRMPFLQGPQTLAALDKMVQYKLIEFENAKALTAAYCFLRDLEHRLQMENHLQTHTIPSDEGNRERLARLMGFSSLRQFDTARRNHTDEVRALYSRFLPADEPATSSDLPERFEGEEAAWRKLLSERGFKGLEQSVRLLKEFTHGPGYVHVSKRTVELARQLIPKFLQLCPSPRNAPNGPQSKVLSDPDRVLARLDSFVGAYGARPVMFETWNSNPSLFELLLLLFDRSEFLAEMAIRTPDLLDELVLSGRLRRGKTAAEILEDLRHGLRDPDQRLWIRKYHQAEFMRIGLRDILGLADAEHNVTELSALAEACLQYALDVVSKKHKFRSPPVAIVGLGKLGGEELNYGSDLDLLFVADARNKEIPKLQRLATDLMELLSSKTELGMAFSIDARLRPDGDKGLLVNTLAAYEEYYRTRAQLWEIQALSRSRPVAGDPKLGERFRSLARALTDFSPRNVAAGFLLPDSNRKPARKKPAKKSTTNKSSPGLAAYSPDWKKQIAHMRQRIEKERTPPGQDFLAIKTGAGGLIDAEFIAQALSLEHGWLEPNSLRALEKARREEELSESDARKLIDNFRQLRRIESILRRWSFEGEAVLPVDPAPFYRVSVRCGFKTPADFKQAVATYRQAIREVYEKTFGAILLLLPA